MLPTWKEWTCLACSRTCVTRGSHVPKASLCGACTAAGRKKPRIVRVPRVRENLEVRMARWQEKLAALLGGGS